MILKTKVSFAEYCKLLYFLMYTKPPLILIVFIDVVLLGWILGYYAHLLDVSRPSVYQFLTAFLITVIQPFGIYYVIWRNYHSSSYLMEPLEIECTTTIIKITGESFYTELKWEKINKVVELKDWYLIYQNYLTAVILPKRSFSEAEKEEFSALLDAIPPRVPVQLKKWRKAPEASN